MLVFALASELSMVISLVPKIPNKLTRQADWNSNGYDQTELKTQSA